MTDSPSSSVDVNVLRQLAEAFGAGADLVEPSELMLCSGRSADDVDAALATMRRHRPELFWAVLDADGRVVAVTGITCAGRNIARTWSGVCAGAGKRRGAILRRLATRVLVGAAVAGVVRMVSDHLRLD